jgi:hypothetical protein
MTTEIQSQGNGMGIVHFIDHLAIYLWTDGEGIFGIDVVIIESIFFHIQESLGIDPFGIDSEETDVVVEEGGDFAGVWAVSGCLFGSDAGEDVASGGFTDGELLGAKMDGSRIGSSIFVC